MSRQDDYIFKCARRMIEKMGENNYYKLNGEFSKPVQIEISRMKKLCAKSPQINTVEEG